MNPNWNLVRPWASLIIGVVLCLGLLRYGITEEVPLWSLKGVIKMKESGKPLPNAMVTVTRIPDNEEEQTRGRVIELSEEGEFTLRNLIAGQYEVTVSAKAHQLDTKVLEVKEGKPTIWEVEASPVEPYLDIYASQRVYTPDESPKFELKGFMPKDDVKVVAYKLDFNKVIKEGSLYNALAPLARRDNTAADPTTMGVKVQSLGYEVKNRDAEGTFIESVEVPSLAEGLYWVEVYGGKIRKGTWFSVSRVATILKQAGKKSTVYVTSIDKGQPIQGASVGYVVQGVYKESTKTDSQGLAHLNATTDGSGVMVAMFGESRALVDFYSGSEDQANSQVKTVAYTDRPIYRPGDEIQFKAISRKLVGSDYKVPGKGEAVIEIRDPDDSLLEKMTLPVSEMGTFSGRYTLNKESTPGQYAIVCKYQGAESILPVSVAAYRKPTYSIKVEPEKPFYIRGEKVKMKVKTEYYFGGPVPGAEVSASVYKEPYWDPFLYGEEFAEYYAEEGYDSAGYGGEYSEEIKTTTDENGVAEIEFDTRPSPEEQKNEYAYEQDYRYNVTVSIADDAGKYYDGKGSVKVMRGEFGISVETDRYMTEPGKPITAKIKAFSHDGHKPMAGLEVETEAGYYTWRENDSSFARQEGQTVTTNAEGEAEVTYTPKGGGDFQIKASARDSRANVVKAAQYVWVYGGADNPRASGKLSLTLDKRQYNIGDTAELLVTSENPGGSALVTVEGDDVYTTKVVALTGKSTAIQMPIDKIYAPNAFVSVAYIKDKLYSESSKRVSVDLGSKKLQVKVESDKATYKPGETATYKIQTTDAEGKPVSAECSVAVVDESIYAIAEDKTDLLTSFYPKRYNSVSTSYSFPELYLDGGDKAPTSIEVRRRFKDTAYWAPVVQTDAAGQSTVSVPLPDNLTTWRVTVAGITTDTAVGMATSKAISKKDLMVRLEAPAFLVAGDKQKLTAMVTNGTGQSVSVRVQLESDGIRVEGTAVKPINLDANSSGSVDWNLEPSQSGTATLVAKAWVDNGPNDGVELKLPVSPHGRLFVDQFAGDIKGETSLKVVVRDKADIPSGRLRLTVTPSLANSLVQGLDELIGFPYGCVEQTMSRFMPTVVVSQALATSGMPKPDNAAQIPEMVKEGYARLYKMQHSDGGWGWWENDESDMFMTAYVLDGMKRAMNAGYQPNAQRLERGLAWAEKRYKERVDTSKLPAWERNRRATEELYLAYALAQHGRKDAAVDVAANLSLSNLPSGGLAMAVLVMHQVESSDPAKKAQALKNLVTSATDNGTIAHWNEDFWGIETTARNLFAIASVNPDHPIIPRVVRYLMRARKGDMWYSTRDTAFALLALVKYFGQTKELEQTGAIDILVNGQQVQQIMVTPKTLLGPETIIEVPLSQLKAGDNRIQFVSATKGTSYYSADLRQVVVQDEIGQLINADGLSIDRQYYKLEPKRTEDGRMKLMKSDKPIDHADPGDIIRVELNIKADKVFEYVMIEDPIPAACRITEREDLGPEDEWTWWWTKLVILDDKASFFSRRLEIGQNTITYNMRVENPGFARALPTIIAPMYDPGLRASSSENKLEVSQR